MLLLTSTSDKLQLTTGQAVTLDVHASWVDNNAGTITPGRKNTAITSAGTTDIVLSPASGQRNIKTIEIRNKHATDSVDVIVTHTDGAIPVELFCVTLLAQQHLHYAAEEGFKVINSAGQALVGPSTSPAGVVPVGGIIMWSGTIAAIVAGWALCDGVANAPGPDLTDKFVVGASVDDSGVAKTNIEGSLKVTGGVTGVQHSAHANLTHAGGAVGDHTGLTHSLAIANHPDLTHAALSHPATTFAHADHSVASASHSHAAITLTHADHSIASANAALAAFTLTHADHSLASANAAVPAVTLTHASHPTNNAVVPAVTLTHASHPTNNAALPAFTITHADHSVASRTVSGIPAITLTHADHSIASHANISVPSHSHAVVTIVSGTGSKATGGSAVTFVSVSGVSTLSGPSMVSIAGASIAAATYTHADHSVASQAGSLAAFTLTHADHSIAAASATLAGITHADHSVAAASGTIAGITHADHSVAAASGTIAAQTVTHADHSVAGKSATIAALTVTHADHSVASFSGTNAAFSLTHADHSFPSLSHQAIGTHVGTDYGVHGITQPGDHGTAGTLTHSFTQPDVHTISDHDTVLTLPNYYALAFIQRMV